MAKKKNLKQKLKQAQNEVQQKVEKPKVAQAETKSTAGTNSGSGDGMLFHKENYILMGIGLVLILLGFALMAGGKSADPNVFDKEALFSFRRITLAPILVLIGFAIEGYAILKTPNKA